MSSSPPFITPLAELSQFINALLPNHLPAMKVGERESFEPCTTTAEHCVLDMATLSDTLGTQKDYRLVLVDTPGLNTREKPDSEIVADIAKWSRDVYVPSHIITVNYIYGEN